MIITVIQFDGKYSQMRPILIESHDDEVIQDIVNEELREIKDVFFKNAYGDGSFEVETDRDDKEIKRLWFVNRISHLPVAKIMLIRIL